MKGQAGHQHGHIAVNAVAASLLQTHAVQGHIQFFGHQHGQRGVDALTHFTARHGQHHGTVGCDLDPAVQGDIPWGLEHEFGRAQTRACRHDAPTDDQCAGRAQCAE